jgi:hypothetical protein
MVSVGLTFQTSIRPLSPSDRTSGSPRFLVNDERMSSNSAWDTSRRLGLLPADPGGCPLSSSNA